jgi:hypothetical protein
MVKWDQAHYGIPQKHGLWRTASCTLALTPTAMRIRQIFVRIPWALAPHLQPMLLIYTFNAFTDSHNMPTYPSRRTFYTYMYIGLYENCLLHCGQVVHGGLSSQQIVHGTNAFKLMV